MGIPLSLVLVGIPIVVSAYLRRENTAYVVTTEALYRKSGVFSRSVQRVDFGKVQNTTYSQGFFGQQFGYGTVDVSTAGGAGVELAFESVPKPKHVQELINRRIKDDSTDRPTDKATVLYEVLAELRAIRAAIEGEGRDSQIAAGEGTDDAGGSHDRRPWVARARRRDRHMGRRP